MNIPQKKAIQGKIILIDGTSTSGKTSIVNELVKILHEPYEKVAIDDFVIEVIMQQKKLNLPKAQFIERIWNASDKMFDKINQLAKQGINICIDTVLSGIEGEKELLHGLSRLNGLNTKMILVYCPLNILAQRVFQRNEQAIRENNLENIRSLIDVVRFADIYKPQKSKNDIIVGQISIKDIEYAYTPPKNSTDIEIKNYNEIKDILIKHFELIDKNFVNITSNINYDFIVDSSKRNPVECAENIYTNLNLSGNLSLEKNCIIKNIGGA